MNDRFFKALTAGLKGVKRNEPNGVEVNVDFKHLVESTKSDKKSKKDSEKGKDKKNKKTSMNSEKTLEKSSDKISMNSEKSSDKKQKRPAFTSEQDANTFRHRKLIKVYGEDVPLPVRRFSQLGLPEWLVERIPHAKPTPVQMQATPILMAGRDALVIAPTGSGKTLAFLLGMLDLLERRRCNPTSMTGPRGLVIAPTRELAQQIWAEAKGLVQEREDCRKTGQHRLRIGLIEKALVNNWREEREKAKKRDGSSDQQKSLVYPDLLISSPLSLINAVEDGLVGLGDVEMVVFDEGDKLLELGYLEQLDTLLQQMMMTAVVEPKRHCPLQKVLFSATIPTGIEQVARSFMAADLVKLVIGRPNASVSTIEQRLLFVGQESGKLMAIRQMLAEGSLRPPAIIFCETIDRAVALFNDLLQRGIAVDIIHGSRSPTERTNIVRQFRAGKIWVLITTELLARGLDFPTLATVINYDFPRSTASYIHRIGRTGRAGRPGTAVTLFKLEDAERLRVVVNVMRQTGCEVPEWMLNARAPSTDKKRKYINMNNNRRAKEQ